MANTPSESTRQRVAQPRETPPVFLALRRRGGRLFTMTNEELASAGLFDPNTDSPRRADLLRRCLELGMTIDEVRDAGDDLIQRAIDAVFQGGHEQLTLAQVAERAGIDGDALASIARATGFVGANENQLVWNEDDIASMAVLAAGWEFLGEQALMQLMRVSTAAIGRIGDAVTSTFLTSVGASATAEDDSGLGLLEANVAGAALLEDFGPWLNRSLVRHLRMSFRETSDTEAAVAFTDGIDTPELAVGFADLVGSTSHAERRSLVELNTSLQRFEMIAIDVVARHGGRIVKFIGDEVMFRADTADVAAAIALDLVQAVRADSELPPIRAAVVYGMVLSREGDFHGPTVNLAARVLSLAPMNGVVVPLPTAERLVAGAGIDVDSLGAIEMPRLAEPVELAALRRS